MCAFALVLLWPLIFNYLSVLCVCVFFVYVLLACFLLVVCLVCGVYRPPCLLSNCVFVCVRLCVCVCVLCLRLVPPRCLRLPSACLMSCCVCVWLLAVRSVHLYACVCLCTLLCLFVCCLADLSEWRLVLLVALV